jgi:hypothetical protein
LYQSLKGRVCNLAVPRKRSTTDAQIRDERAKSPKHQTWRVFITASASSKVAYAGIAEALISKLTKYL